jgi:hypothetical protein
MADESKRPYVDPGHVLPDEDWAKVVARAAEIREEVQADAEGGASGVGGIVLDMTGLGVASRKYFGVSGIPTQLLVLHSAECPLQGGYAKSLTEWASPPYPAAPEASWHRFVDPVHRVRFVPDELGAWHASEANNLSIGWEQAGYARYSRDQWLTADGRVQLEMLALDMAEVALRDGIPARWLSTAEVRAVLDSGNRSIKGFCTHRQIDPETRTDPGDGYPYDLLMERVKAYMAGEDIDMPLTPEDRKAIALEVWGFANPELDPRDMRQMVADIAAGNITMTNLYGTNLTVGEQLGHIDKNLNDARNLLAALITAQPGVVVQLSSEDVAHLAETLKASLAPELAADLSRRLAE